MRPATLETSVAALPFTMGGPYNRVAGQLWEPLEIRHGAHPLGRNDPFVFNFSGTA